MPVDLGLPPVISAVPPGSESDGLEVNALVYSLPECVNLASVELGWLATYQSRSLWCMPSTEISSTCLLTGAGACAAALAELCNANSAHAAAAAPAARHAKVLRMVTETPVRGDLSGTPEFPSRAKSACWCEEQRMNPSKPPVDRPSHHPDSRRTARCPEWRSGRESCVGRLNGVSEFVGRARAFVAERFPSARAAFLGGSTASGHATETSDLDVLVVLPEEWADVSFVETTMFQGQLVEAFVYGRAALERWLEKGRAERRPVLDRFIAEGVALTDNAPTRALAEASRETLAAGPSALTSDELRLRAYTLSGLVDDLADSTEPGERFVILTTAWREAAELALLLDQRWLGTGKWLLRELRRTRDRFGLVEWAASSEHDVGNLLAAGHAVLDASGGYLQNGFIRGQRPPGL